MNNREAFDLVRKHLLTQGEPCRDHYDGACCYRNGKGQKCAIGALIPDDMYCAGIEGMPVSELVYTDPDFEDLFSGLNISMLERLQELHDECYVEYWKEDLDKMEKEFFVDKK